MSDFSKSSVFALGQENTAYAQYFIGKSYLNMLSTQFMCVLCIHCSYELRTSATHTW